MCSHVLNPSGNGYNPVFACVNPSDPNYLALNGQGRTAWGCDRLYTQNSPVNFNNSDGFGLMTAFAFAASSVALLGAVLSARQVMALDPTGRSKMDRFSLAVAAGITTYGQKRLGVVVSFVLIFFAAICGILFNNVGTQCAPWVEDVSTNTCNPFIGAPGLNTVGVFTGLAYLTGVVMFLFVTLLINVLVKRGSAAIANAASTSAKAGAVVAVRTGAAIAFAAAGAMLMGLVVCIMVLTIGTYDQRLVWQYLVGFGFGASTASFFVRFGGGLFAKAASLGTDLASKLNVASVGSINNSGVVGEAVGAIVSETYGSAHGYMESWMGSIIAAAILGFSTYSNLNLSREQVTCLFGTPDVPRFMVQTNYAISAIAYPLWLAALQIVCNVFGMQVLRPAANDSATAVQQEMGLTWQFRGAAILSSCSYIGLSALVSWICFGSSQEEWNLYGCCLVGVVASLIIGVYVNVTSQRDQYVMGVVAAASDKGPAAFVVESMAVSNLLHVVTVGLLVVLLVACNALGGTYGVAIAAVSMHTNNIIVMTVLTAAPFAESAVRVGEMCLDEVKPEGLTRIDVVMLAIRNMVHSSRTVSMAASAMTAVVLTFSFVQNTGQALTDFDDPVVLAGGFIGAFLPFLCMALVLLPLGPMGARLVCFAARCTLTRARAPAAEHAFLTVKAQVDKEPQLNDGSFVVAKDSTTVSGFVESLHFLTVMNLITPLSLLVLTPFVVAFMLGSLAHAATLFATVMTSLGLGLSLGSTGRMGALASYQLRKGKAGSADALAATLGSSVTSPLHDTVAPALMSWMRALPMLSLLLAPVFQMTNVIGTVFQTQSWWYGLLAGGFWVLFVILPRHFMHGNKFKATRNKQFNAALNQLTKTS